MRKLIYHMFARRPEVFEALRNTRYPSYEFPTHIDAYTVLTSVLVDFMAHQNLIIWPAYASGRSTANSLYCDHLGLDCAHTNDQVQIVFLGEIYPLTNAGEKCGMDAQLRFEVSTGPVTTRA
jgi:hypothetical protein